MSDTPNNESQNRAESDSEGNDKKRRRRRRGKRRPDRDSSDQQHQSQQQQSADASESGNDGSEGAEKSDNQGRRRPNRRKKKRNTSGDEVAADKNQQGDAVADSPSEEDSDSADKNQRGDRRGRGQKSQRSDKQEKKERPKRGSVLDRRRTRGETVLEFPDDEPVLPTAPAPIAKNVDGYIKHLRGWQREVVTSLRGIIKGQASEANEEILWSQPVYTLDGPVVYIKAFSDHVNLGFWRGNEIEDESGRLIGEMPTMRHITIRSAKEMDRDLFEELVRQAFRLNKERGSSIL